MDYLPLTLSAVVCLTETKPRRQTCKVVDSQFGHRMKKHDDDPAAKLFNYLFLLKRLIDLNVCAARRQRSSIITQNNMSDLTAEPEGTS